ncbi:MAG: protein kinase [Anaerolineae bacterium]|nr:protein kinase [Anaerolineae bacterium]
MNACPSCGTLNRLEARFCRLCRCPLPSVPVSTCPRCGGALRQGVRFCKHCGMALSKSGGPAPTAPTRGPRRICPNCNTSVRAAARFCANCRSPLTASTAPTGRKCPHCGTVMRAGARFCRICSHPLGHEPPPLPPSPPPAMQPGRFGTGELLPLTVLAKSRYVVLEKIAQGGMGAIYKAQDRRLQDKVVAVKEMSESAIAPAERVRILDCFKREAELLARLEHPNLVRVSDLFQEGDRHYMVMEFVDGQTLEKMLEGRAEPFPEGQVLAWGEQLCDVLDYLHGQKPQIIYRDIKPANVMVVNGSDTVKLIDFGIARFFKPGKRRDTIELGTDGYAPPEQYGKSQTDVRADVYALGAMLHQLLTLRDPVLIPFQFPGVRSLNPRVCPRVDEAIAKAVRPAKDKRHQSIKEMREALLGDGALPRGKQPEKRPPGKPAQKVLRIDPDRLDFGHVVVGGSFPSWSVSVDIPPGEKATLSTDVLWLHVRPQNIDKSGEATVMVSPRYLKLGRRSLKGLRWLTWPVRLLVPVERRSSGCVEIKSKSDTTRLPVSLIATPSGGRVFLGWIGAIFLVSAEVSILGMILLALLGLVFGFLSI